MPGLAGLISDRSEEVLFRSMQDSMNHFNYVVHPYVLEGLHLSQISPAYSISNQKPVHSSDKKYSLLFCGEIFSLSDNLENVGNDSAAFFLRQVEQQGLEVVRKINGQFSACLHDHPQNITYLISDRFGTHPLYYTVNNNRFLFASEVKALLKDNLSRKIDYHSVAELFSFGHLFGDKTLFENVHQLPPATILKFSQNKVDKTEYWTYPYREEIYQKQSLQKTRSRELEETLAQILVDATQHQSSSAKDILIPLSGGLDSRYVAALYHHIGERNISTFTMGPDESEDQQYGSRVAYLLGYPHHKFEIKPRKTWEAASTFSYVSDAMSFIGGPLQNFEPLEYFAGQKKIVVAPQMADAIFGSTLWRKRIRILQANHEPRSVTNEILINLFKVYDQNQVKQLFQADVYSKIEGLYRQVPQGYCREEYHPLHNYYALLMNEHGRRGTFGGNIVTNLFYSMRMLSYDHQVFDFGWNLPIVYREHQYLYRKTFCRLFPELAKIKRQGYNLDIGASQSRYELKVLENKIATLAMKSPLKNIAKYYKPWNRPSYVNYDRWFKGELRNELTSFLTDKELKCGALINVKYVKTMLNEHQEGKRNNAALLWQVINLEYFFRNFMD